MSILYFDVEDEAGARLDNIGCELPASADICTEALGLLVDIARDERSGASRKKVTVRDAIGKRIFVGELSLTGQKLNARASRPTASTTSEPRRATPAPCRDQATAGRNP